MTTVADAADAAAAAGAIWAADSWFDLCRGAYSVWSRSNSDQDSDQVLLNC